MSNLHNLLNIPYFKGPFLENEGSSIVYFTYLNSTNKSGWIKKSILNIKNILIHDSQIQDQNKIYSYKDFNDLEMFVYPKMNQVILFKEDTITLNKKNNTVYINRPKEYENLFNINEENHEYQILRYSIPQVFRTTLNPTKNINFCNELKTLHSTESIFENMSEEWNKGESSSLYLKTIRLAVDRFRLDPNLSIYIKSITDANALFKKKRNDGNF